VAGRLGTRVVAILVPVLAALALTGSGSWKFEGPWAVSYGDLLSHPEANLFYPGSRLLQSGGWEEYAELCRGPGLMCTPGDVPAFVENQLVVDGASPSEIYGWYQDELSASGWRPAPSGDSIHIQAYVRGPGERFDVNVQTVDDSPELPGIQRSVVLYFTGYRLGTCPSIEAGCHSHLVAVGPNDPGPAKHLPSARTYLDDVTNRPEAHLYFPASSLVGSNGYGEGAGHLFGFDDPWVRVDLIAPVATREEIEGWYRSELAARGYRLVATDSSGVTEEYRRGSEIFKLILPEPDNSRGPYSVAGLMFTAIYQIDTCEGHHPPVCRA
jgi:hypothetical protein